MVIRQLTGTNCSRYYNYLETIFRIFTDSNYGLVKEMEVINIKQERYEKCN